MTLSTSPKGVHAFLQGVRLLPAVILCLTLPSWPLCAAQWIFSDGKAQLAPDSAVQESNLNLAIACLKQRDGRLYLDIDARYFEEGDPILISFYVDGVKFSPGGKLVHRKAALDSAVSVASPAFTNKESWKFLSALMNARRISWELKAGRRMPLPIVNLNTTMRALAQYCFDEVPGENRPTWHFSVDEWGASAVVMPHDRPTDAYQSPVIFCRTANKIGLGLDLDARYPRERVKVGDPVIVSFYIDGAEFRFASQAEAIWPDGAAGGLTVSPELSGPWARRFVAALLEARQVAWAVNHGRRWMLPATNRLASITKLAAACGFPQGAVRGAQ